MSKAKKIKELKNRFKTTVEEVASTTGLAITEVTRDVYVRVSVDTKMTGRLNKEELVEIGGFGENMKSLFFTESNKLPRILVLDLETSNIIAKVWGLFNQNIGLNQIVTHSSVFSYSAKFIGEDKIYYNDTFFQKDKRDDKKIIKELIDLLNRSDMTLSHNGIKFDLPRIRARAAINGLTPPKATQEIDTLRIAKRMGFDSRKLEHLTHMLCKKHKKLINKKFAGQALWNEFENGNPEAQIEMMEYNKLDVLSLEELYLDHLAPYDISTANFSSYNDSPIFKCNCGNDTFKPAGFHITKKAKYEKVQCTKCGKTHRSSKSVHNKEKRDSLLV